MKLQFTFIHLDHSEALQEYAQNRLDEISSFLLKEGQGQVTFSKLKTDFSVQVSIHSKMKYFRASGHSTDAYEAVDKVAMKLEKQFLKTRKLHQNHKKYDLSKSGRMRHLNQQMEYQPRYKKAA